MKKGLLVFFSLLILAVGSNEARANSTKDQAYEKAILGDWTQKEIGGFARFKENGGYFASIPRIDSRFPCVIEGAWWIKEGILYNRADGLTSPCFPTHIKVGDVVTDTIVGITQDKMILIDNEVGHQYEKNRIH